MRWILASGSPRRKQLLELIDLPFETVPPNVDESLKCSECTPAEVCCKLAELKACEISSQYPGAIVIGADTIVVLENEIIGKPQNDKDAKSILRRLSGHTHQVFTAVSIQCLHPQIHHTFFEATDVTFKALSDTEIEYYVNHYNPFDKAGGYGIQDFSAVFVSSIHGCYHNVVGFPLSRFTRELRTLNLSIPGGPL